MRNCGFAGNSHRFPLICAEIHRIIKITHKSVPSASEHIMWMYKQRPYGEYAHETHHICCCCQNGWFTFIVFISFACFDN